MKRTLFSALFVACAAFVSLFSFTGCGGGGGEGQSSDNPMTLEQFAAGTRTYLLMNTTYGFIRSNGDHTPGGDLDNPNKVVVYGTFRAGEALAPNALFTYERVVPENADGEATDPAQAEYLLTISFQFTTDLEQADFLSVLGQGAQIGGDDEEGNAAQVQGGSITLRISPGGKYTVGSFVVNANGEVEDAEEGGAAAGGGGEEEITGLYLNILEA